MCRIPALSRAGTSDPGTRNTHSFVTALPDGGELIQQKVTKRYVDCSDMSYFYFGDPCHLDLHRMGIKMFYFGHHRTKLTVRTTRDLFYCLEFYLDTIPQLGAEIGQ